MFMSPQASHEKGDQTALGLTLGMWGSLISSSGFIRAVKGEANVSLRGGVIVLQGTPQSVFRSLKK